MRSNPTIQAIHAIRDARDAAMVALVRDGHAALHVASVFGVQIKTVCRACREAGVTLRRGPSPKTQEAKRQNRLAKPKRKIGRKRPHVDYAEVVRLYESGLSMREVGKRFGVSKQHIHQILVEQGAPRRTRTMSEACKRADAARRLKLPGWVIRRYRAGERPGELARALGVSRNGLVQALKRAGAWERRSYPSPARKLSPKAVEAIRRELADPRRARTVTQIAEAYGVSHGLVSRIGCGRYPNARRKGPRIRAIGLGAWANRDAAGSEVAA